MVEELHGDGHLDISRTENIPKLDVVKSAKNI